MPDNSTFGGAVAPGGRISPERGSVTLEAAIAAPVLMLLVFLIVFAGRAAMAAQMVKTAAWDAVRTASIARTESQAVTTATAAAAASLANQGIACGPRVSIESGGFRVPVGTAATVRATVHCTVDLSDIGLPGLPGSITLSASATSALDTRRERS